MIESATVALGFVCQVGLGVMFLWSAAGKTWEWSAFQSTVRGLGLAPGIADVAAVALIAAEFCLGALLPTGWDPTVTISATWLLLLFFAGLGVYVEARGLTLSCSCFGQSRTRLGRATSIRAVALALPALVFWLSSRLNPPSNHPDAAVATAVLVLCAGLLLRMQRAKTGDSRARAAPQPEREGS